MDSDWALDRARENVEASYPVVGVLERLNETIQLLQAKYPKLFAGAAKQGNSIHVNVSLYKPGQSFGVLHSLGGIHRNPCRVKQAPLSASARDIWRRGLRLEYQFYQFINHRLDQQQISSKMSL